METSGQRAGASGISIGFYGGAGTVTGSRHLLVDGGSELLVDCGMFQGMKALRLLNWKRPAFDPAAVDAMVLTHAHMDHVGMVPRLVRDGFRGRVYCTPPTRELAEVVLLDAAKLQEEDAAYANRKGYSKHKPALPLYTAADVQRALERFSSVDYESWWEPAAGVRARFHNAGHILGSAFVEVEAPGPRGVTRVVFSGDIGRYGVELHTDPDALPACEVLAVESTYGNRVHPATTVLEQVKAPFTEVLGAGGTILIPSFAMARTQLVTLMLGELMEQGEIPRVPVHVDSPMAVEITRIYNKYLDTGGLDAGLRVGSASKILPSGTEFATTVESSKALNKLPGPRIIVSSSGMLTGGRAVHHLERLLPDKRNMIVLVGFQSPGTRGRSLKDGAAFIRMHGRDVPVAARVLSVEGMSAHADSTELMRWVRSGPALPGRAFVTHGEPDAAGALVQALDAAGVKAQAPSLNERFDLAATGA